MFYSKFQIEYFKHFTTVINILKYRSILISKTMYFSNSFIYSYIIIGT